MLSSNPKISRFVDPKFSDKLLILSSLISRQILSLFNDMSNTLQNTAEDESDLIRNIQFFLQNVCKCVNILHSLFGITFVLFLLKLSAGKV